MIWSPSSAIVFMGLSQSKKANIKHELFFALLYRNNSTGIFTYIYICKYTHIPNVFSIHTFIRLEYVFLQPKFSFKVSMCLQLATFSFFKGSPNTVCGSVCDKCTHHTHINTHKHTCKKDIYSYICMYVFDTIQKVHLMEKERLQRKETKWELLTKII